VIERLEIRRLFAVNVAQGFPGFYEVTGDDADDSITITVDQTARSITVNNVTYARASFVNVYGYGGNDSISVSGSNGVIGVAIRGGDGDDVLSLAGVSGGVWGGAGSDRIDLESSFRGQAYGEEGNDHIVVTGLCPGADLRGGDGDDVIDAQGSTVAVVLFGDDGRDRLYGSPKADILDGGAGRDYLFGREGDDQFYTRDGELDYVVGGGGDDTCQADVSEMMISGVKVILTP
jgi:Ca2+-binding RTX toxin-like protein